jgi:hypothetical protein
MLNFFIVLFALGVGVYFDVFNKKMVPDIIWTIGATLGIFAIIFTGSPFFVPLKIAEIVVIFVIGHYTSKFNLWGGADARAWIMMTAVLPFGVSTIILSNSFLIAFLILPIYLFVSGIKFKDWGSFPMPFILFMYLGTLSYVLFGWITFGT